MDKNIIIIIALVVAVIAILAGAFAVMPNMNKQDTNLTLMSNSTINEGDSIVIKLTDSDGNLLVNQTVNVSVTDNNKTSSQYSLVTNETGFGVLKLDKTAGKYNVSISYGGNDKYNGCNVTQTLTIKDNSNETDTQQSSATSSSSNSKDNEDYYNGYSRDEFSPGEQAAIDDARANGYNSPAEYYEATGKTAGQ